MRQKGRFCGGNVLFCGTDREQILSAISLMLTSAFQATFATMKNPYGDGNSCQKVYELIKRTDFSKMLKKTEDPLELS
jgi:UDP-N-acetylglucosamine 2-epimerase